MHQMKRLEGALDEKRQRVEEAQAKVARLESQVGVLLEEAAEAQREYSTLASLHFAATAELNETKNMLVRGQRDLGWNLGVGLSNEMLPQYGAPSHPHPQPHTKEALPKPSPSRSLT